MDDSLRADCYKNIDFLGVEDHIFQDDKNTAQ